MAKSKQTFDVFFHSYLTTTQIYTHTTYVSFWVIVILRKLVYISIDNRYFFLYEETKITFELLKYDDPKNESSIKLWE